MNKTIITTAITLALASATITTAHASNKTLNSVKIDQEIMIDGSAEGIWDSAESLKVKLNKLPYKPENGYDGIKRTDVFVKSLYDNENVYFLYTYKDPTKSLNRFPWVKQEDGTWKQLINKDETGHENTYYEDKFAVYWDINTEGFAKKGCNEACHRAKDGKINGIEDKNPARKYTDAGEYIDMWHWKGVRRNEFSQLDDQYVDSNTDPKKNKGWGRKGDDKTGGVYVNNKKDGQPAYVMSDLTDESVIIDDNKKVAFTADYDQTSRIPGVITSAYTGSRGDVVTKGVWAEGVWTIEIKRKLITTHTNSKTQDVQFDDLTKQYPFGLAVFDNSQINHLYHRGAYNLKFK
ncbi:ethylbenzene dehydrogenase-related protein [Vibrio sp. SS-MA-C1-2]|uniref:ethylbenzene dehydrogenase-related protein n=1 Tax=Vibrio sp. SS-MA-C1-2 TaxID=2908646 RepID=UPI001F46DEFB|nr:ethylbenzene dehydrogenase-related protein [Vibrio sp. SS-MA-C1-2]UJF18050.1 ethylbenzene dehydrogenase-related protein [Vibrio sp. SS-MA-C1-2]